MSDTLWTDDKLAEGAVEIEEVLDASSHMTLTDAIELGMKEVRDSYEAALDDLRRQLEEAQTDAENSHVEAVMEGQMRLIAEQRIKELEAQLATAQATEWQPLPLDATTSHYTNGKVVWVETGAEVRFCCRTPRQPVHGPVPDWTQVADHLEYHAIDPSGEGRFYQFEPIMAEIIDRSGWRLKTVNGIQQGDCCMGEHYDLPLGIDWRQTLRRRPTAAKEEE